MIPPLRAYFQQLLRLCRGCNLTAHITCELDDPCDETRVCGVFEFTIRVVPRPMETCPPRSIAAAAMGKRLPPYDITDHCQFAFWGKKTSSACMPCTVPGCPASMWPSGSTTLQYSGSSKSLISTNACVAHIEPICHSAWMGFTPADFMVAAVYCETLHVSSMPYDVPPSLRPTLNA